MARLGIGMGANRLLGGPGIPPFVNIVKQTVFSDTNFVQNRTFNFTSNKAGNELVIIMGSFQNSCYVNGGGWTSIGGAGNADRCIAGGRKAAVGGAESVPTFGAQSGLFAIVFELEELKVFGTAASANLATPQASVGTGPEKTLWVCATNSQGSMQGNVPTPPAGYTLMTIPNIQQGLAIAYKIENSQFENPGEFSHAFNNTANMTVGFR